MTIGIVGGGQLGRMLALAGYPLGLEFLFVDRAADAPVAPLAPVLVGDLEDPSLLRELARRCDVLSFDWENVPVKALAPAARGTRIAPPPARARRRAGPPDGEAHLERLHIPTTRFAAVDSRAALDRAVRRIGLPGVLKTRRLGYDGKGQYVLREAADIEIAWQRLGTVPLLYEEFIPFDYEVSIIGARGRDGSTVVYPLNRNWHSDGILRMTVAPWSAPRLERAAAASLRRVLEAFRYVGVLTSSSLCDAGGCWPNEMAPRVHNSGHCDDRRRGHESIRESSARHHGPAARTDNGARPFGDDQSDWRTATGIGPC